MLRFTIRAFFSKKEQIIGKKVLDLKNSKPIDTLNSVVEQDDLSDEQIQQLIDQRIKFNKEVCAVTKVPLDAWIAMTMLSSPLVGASIYCLLNPNPLVFVAAVKYSGMLTCFQAGVHWGTALSLHEQQTDPFNSSTEACVHFGLATLPLLSTMGILHYAGYSEVFFSTGLALLATTNIYTLGIDIYSVKKSQLPKWWLRVKVPFMILLLASLGTLAYVREINPEGLVIRSPYKYQTADREKLLRSSS